MKFTLRKDKTETEIDESLNSNFEQSNVDIKHVSSTQENDINTPTSTPIEIPDKFSGYGLLTLISCFLFNISTWGSNSGYSIYLAHYLNYHTFKGSKKIDFGILGGLTFGSGLTFAPFINYTIGKIGLKPTMIIGSVIQFAGVLLASFSTRLWQIYLTQGVLQGIGMAINAIANINLLPQWFRKKRNVATGITSSGSGIGGIICTVGMQQVMNHKSFRWSLRAQAIICFGCQIIAIILAKSRNAHIKPVFKIFDKLVWINFGVWCLIFYMIFTLLGYVVLMYNLSDFTLSLGYSSSDGSIVSMMISIGIIIGRPSVGILADKYGPVLIGSIMSLIVSIFSFAMWIPAHNLATTIIFALIVGSFMGTIWVIMAPITTTVAGLKKMGIAMAVLWIFVGISGFVSPIIGIVLKSNDIGGRSDPTEYRHPAIFVGLCYFMASLTLFIMRGWLVARNELMISIKSKEGLDDGYFENTNAELTLKVLPQKTIKNLFNFSNGF